MQEIPLGFANSRLYEKDGEVHYDMWPMIDTHMAPWIRGPVTRFTVIENTTDRLVVCRGFTRYTFEFKARKVGPDAVTYSTRLLGFLTAGVQWGDISSEGKRALRKAFRQTR